MRDEGRSRDASRRIARDDAIGARRPFVVHRLSSCPPLVGTEKTASSRVPEIPFLCSISTLFRTSSCGTTCGRAVDRCCPHIRVVPGGQSMMIRDSTDQPLMARRRRRTSTCRRYDDRAVSGTYIGKHDYHRVGTVCRQGSPTLGGREGIAYPPVTMGRCSVSFCPGLTTIFGTRCSMVGQRRLHGQPRHA